MIRLLPLLIALLFGSSACVHVAPYEREQLANPTMDLSRESMPTRFRAHAFDAREGATGGHGSTGGGCGCN
jgi:hypothetical protein